MKYKIDINDIVKIQNGYIVTLYGKHRLKIGDKLTDENQKVYFVKGIDAFNLIKSPVEKTSILLENKPYGEYLNKED